MRLEGKVNEENETTLNILTPAVFECTDFYINLDDDDERSLPNKLKRSSTKNNKKVELGSFYICRR